VEVSGVSLTGTASTAEYGLRQKIPPESKSRANAEEGYPETWEILCAPSL